MIGTHYRYTCAIKCLNNSKKSVNVTYQLSRDRENPESSLSRVRKSGQTAEAADIIMFIYRPDVYGKFYPEQFKDKSIEGIAMIDIAKGRNIGIFKFLCKFVPPLLISRTLTPK